MNDLTKTPKADVITPLKDTVAGYLAASEMIESLKAKLKTIKEVKETLKNDIVATLKSRGEYSSRFDGSTVTLAVRKTAVVVDEARVIEELKGRGLDVYISEQLNDLFDGPKKEIAAGNEPLPDGMVISETEYISVRKNDKKDARKIVAGEYKRLE